MKNHYSVSRKKALVKEFLIKYKENPKLSATKFGVEALGMPHTAFVKWVKQYDTQNIYKPFNNHDRTKKEKETTFVAVAHQSVPSSNEQSVIVQTNTFNISIPVHCTKQEFLTIFSAIKEMN